MKLSDVLGEVMRRRAHVAGLFRCSETAIFTSPFKMSSDVQKSKKS